MGRASVRRVFLIGLVAGVAGAVLVALSTRTGPAPNIGIYYVGLVLVAAGGLIEVVSWILALVGSAMLGHWGWFIVVLVLGVIGAVVPIMVIYSFLGPTQRLMPQRPMAVG